MFDLVLWSGSLALTPWAHVLAWKLISGVAGLIGPAEPAGSTLRAAGAPKPRRSWPPSPFINGEKKS
jgi:hypothetical protein